MDRRILWLAFSCVFAIAAGVVIFQSMKYGPYIGSDSVEYLEAAANLAQGRGLVLVRASGAVRPLTIHPPFYSIILGTLIMFGANNIDAAKILNALLFSSLILNIAVFQIFYLRRKALAVACVLVLMMPAILGNFMSAMSEALYVFLLFLSIHFLVLYLDHGSTVLLLLAGVCSGLLVLTRFGGLSIIPVGLCVIAIRGSGKRGFLFRWGFEYTSIALLFMMVWILSLLLQHTTRSFVGVDVQTLWAQLAPARVALVNTLFGWIPFSGSLHIATYRGRLVLLTLLLFVLIVIGAWIWDRIYKNSSTADDIKKLLQYSFLCLSSGFSYLIFIMIAYLIAVPRFRMDARIISPAYPVIMLGLLTLVFTAFEARSGGIWKFVSTNAILLVFLVSGLPNTFSYLEKIRSEGAGYSSTYWQNSDIYFEIKELANDYQLISNDIDVIMLYAGKPAFRIPELENPSTDGQLRMFGDNGNAMSENTFKEGRAVLILFFNTYWQFYDIYFEDTDEVLQTLFGGLDPIFQNNLGTIYLYPES